MKLFAQGWSDRRDGPGHRRIYYLKGCNLRCRWCASPESISAGPEPLFYPERTEEAELGYLCPHGAVSGRTFQRAFCRNCPDCACRRLKHPALEWVGFEVSADALADEISALASGWGDFGGVTFGGGEPSVQAEELAGLLAALRRRGIHTAIESNAATPGFPAVMAEAALTIADLKAGTAATFRACTGGDFALVLDNLAAAAERAEQLLLRIPVITGMNDSDAERNAAAEQLLHLHRLRLRATGEPLNVEILQLHHFGEPKYRALGRNYELAGRPEPDPASIRRLEQQLAANGIQLKRS